MDSQQYNGGPQCPKCGGPMYDNRATKKNPRQPDFKCKNKPQQKGGPGCEGVIWPPRIGQAANYPTPAQYPPAQAQPGPVQIFPANTGSVIRLGNGNGNGNRENRIERQHSQEMALRTMELCKPDGGYPDLDEVKKIAFDLTDYYQRDLDNTPGNPKAAPALAGDYSLARAALEGRRAEQVKPESSNQSSSETNAPATPTAAAPEEGFEL